MSKKLPFELELNVGDTEKKIRDILNSVASAEEKFGQLEKAAIEASLNGSASVTDFSKAAGLLKRQIDTTKAGIDVFASSTGKLDIAVGAVKGLAGGFTAVAGAAGLLDDENSDLQKSIALVSQSMAFLNGIQEVSQLLNKKSAVGAFLYSAANKVLSFSIKETAASLGVLKTALVATGIGVVVVLLGAFLANLDRIKAALNGVSSADKDLLENQKKKVESSEKELDAIGKQENILKSQGKTQKDILKLKVQAIGSAIKEQKILIQTSKNQLKSQVDAAQRNKDFLKGVLDFISIPLTLILETVDQVGKAFGKDFGLREGFKESVASLIFDPDEVKEQGEKAIKEQEESLTKLENDLAGYNLSIKDIDKKAAADKKSANEKKDEEKKKSDQAIRDAEIRAIKDQNEKELAEFDEKSKRELEAAGTNEALITQLKVAQGIERQAIIDKQNEAAKKKEEDDAKKAKDDLKKNLDDELSVIRANRLKKQEEAGDDSLSLDDIKAFNLEELTILKQQFDAKLITEEEYLQKVITLNKEFQAKKKSIEDEEKERAKAFDEFRKESVSQTFTILNDLTTANANKIKEQDDKKLAEFEERAKRELELVEGNDKRVKELEKEQAAQRKAIQAEKEKNDKKAFENSKRLAIAETLINTFFAAQTVFRQAADSSITKAFPPYPFIQAGLAVAVGLAKVAKIKSTQFSGSGAAGGGGGSSAGGGTGGGGATPFNPFVNVPTASRVITPEGAGGRTNDAQRVYVVESDISSTQNRVKVIESNSNAQF